MLTRLTVTVMIVALLGCGKDDTVSSPDPDSPTVPSSTARPVAKVEFIPSSITMGLNETRTFVVRLLDSSGNATTWNQSYAAAYGCAIDIVETSNQMYTVTGSAQGHCTFTVTADGVSESIEIIVE